MDGSLFVLLLLSGLFWNSSALSRPYHYINVAISWSEAQSYCRERFTDLATVDSMDDVNRLVNIVDAGYNGSVWIGLKRGTQKRWVWSNGDDTLAQFSNWTVGEPRGDPYNCAVTVNGSWTTYICSKPAYSFCYNESTGYVSVKIYKNWTEAQSSCRKYHTDLATICNKDDMKQLHAMVPSNAWFWIGLFRDFWEWSDKWSRFFRHWAADQPSQSSGSGDCVGMTRNDSGRWSQYSCDLRQPFICHGDELLRKQIVRLQLSCNGKCMLNDPSLQTDVLNKIRDKLKSMGLESESKISWRKKEGEEVFHEEKNLTANSDNDSNHQCTSLK